MKSSSAQAPRLRLLILSCPLMANFVAKVVDGFCEQWFRRCITIRGGAIPCTDMSRRARRQWQPSARAGSGNKEPHGVVPSASLAKNENPARASSGNPHQWWTGFASRGGRCAL